MVSKGLTKAESRTCTNEPLTDECEHSQRCSNPFCKGPVKGRKGKRFCCDHCRMDGHVIRRAKQMKDQVGVVRFVLILDETGEIGHAHIERSPTPMRTLDQFGEGRGAG